MRRPTSCMRSMAPPAGSFGQAPRWAQWPASTRPSWQRARCTSPARPGCMPSTSEGTPPGRRPFEVVSHAPAEVRGVPRTTQQPHSACGRGARLLACGLIRGLPTFTLLFQILACMIESLALPLCMHELLYDNLYDCVQTCVYFFLSFGKALWQSYKVMQPPQIAANCGTTVVYASERFGSSRHPRLKHSEVQPVGPAGCTATAAGRQSCQLQGRPGCAQLAASSGGFTDE